MSCYFSSTHTGRFTIWCSLSRSYNRVDRYIDMLIATPTLG